MFLSDKACWDPSQPGGPLFGDVAVADRAVRHLTFAGRFGAGECMEALVMGQEPDQPDQRQLTHLVSGQMARPCDPTTTRLMTDHHPFKPDQ